MNIIILAAGQPPQVEQDRYPLCLTEFQDTPLIQHILAACKPLKPNKIIVALREEDVYAFHLDRIVNIASPGAIVLSVRGSASGAACTALLAIGYVDNDEELLIISGNEFLDVDFDEIVGSFRVRLLDAGTAVFQSLHPRYSYVKVSEDGMVVEASEKKPISNYATAGFYWFAQGRDFVDAAKNLIRKDANVNGNYYICPTFNELILDHRRIGMYQVPKSHYHPLKTERQIDQFALAMERDRTL